MAERRKPSRAAEVASKATSMGPDVHAMREREMRGLAAGMVGGLPNGLNPGAIREVLKQMGIEAAEETAEGMLKPASKAMKDLLERRKVNTGAPPGVSERRYEELMKKFGFGTFFK